jgi:O-antigen ligase
MMAVQRGGDRRSLAQVTVRTHPLWLAAVLLCAACPVRIFVPTGLTSSFSILDLLVLAALGSLYVDAAVTRRLDLGPPLVLAFLTLPLLANLLSIVWTQDLVATVTSAVVYLEALVLYLFALRITHGLPASQIVRAMRLFVYLLLIPAFFLLFGVPGFGPQELNLSRTSSDYVGYYSRLSHPFIGRSNNLATALAFFVFIFIVWGIRHRNRPTLVAAGVCVTGVALTLSRGVTLALAVSGLLLFFSTRRWRSRRSGRKGRWRGAGLVAVGVLVALVAVWALFQWNANTRDFSSGRLSANGASERGNRYVVALDKIVQRPYLGVGAGAVPDDDLALSGGVHNAYLQQFVAYGIPLGTLSILCLIGVWWSTARLDPAMRTGVSYAVLTQLLLFMTESSYEGTVLRLILYLSVGLGVALLRAEYRTGPSAAQLPPRSLQAVIT